MHVIVMKTVELFDAVSKLHKVLLFFMHLDELVLTFFFSPFIIFF